MISKLSTHAQVDKFKELPLHIAASFGHVDMCGICVTYNMDVNHENFEGCTPLGCALVAHGHVDVAEYLLQVSL